MTGRGEVLKKMRALGHRLQIANVEESEERVSLVDDQSSPLQTVQCLDCGGHTLVGDCWVVFPEPPSLLAGVCPGTKPRSCPTRTW